MLARLRHPNVCLFMGACFDEQAPHWALVTEYISQGSLWDALRDPRGDRAWPLGRRYRVGAGIARGLAYLHAHRPPVLHRDVKSPNVLVDVGDVAKLCDVGLARNAGLGPGGGAIVVGMSQKSPWRRAGLRFGDLVVAIDGEELTHPQQLLTKIREAADDHLNLAYVRDGERVEVEAGLTTRASTLREISIPPLFSYEADRGQREWSVLLGMVRYRSTAAAWRLRLLWIIALRSGDADELQESGT